MSQNYANKKVQEALKLCNGNATLAKKQIIELAHNDIELLKALTRPHLDGIVAYQIERVVSGRAELESRHPNEPVKGEDNNFGMELLRAIADENVTVFGQEEGYVSKKRKVASKQHIDAIHHMAASQSDKKNNKDTK